MQACSLSQTHVASHSVELVVTAMREADNRSPPSEHSLGSVTPMTDASFDMADTVSQCGSDHSPAQHQTFYIREDMVKIQVRNIELC
jgi:hypothetical protein